MWCRDTNILHTSKLRSQRSRSQRDITYQQWKRYKSGTDKLTGLKLDDNYPRAERNMWHMFKVIRSNTEIAIATTRIARFRSYLVQSLIMWLLIYYECWRSKCQRWRSQRNVIYQKVKSYKRATDNLRDFKLGTAVWVKVEKDWRGVGRSQVASLCSRFFLVGFWDLVDWRIWKPTSGHFQDSRQRVSVQKQPRFSSPIRIAAALVSKWSEICDI